MRADAAKLALIVGKTQRTIYNWVEDGCPHTKGADGYVFDTGDVFEWYATRNDGDQASKEQKTRLTRAQADKTELEAARLRAELVPAEQVQRVWNRMCGAFRARVLALPNKAAQQTIAAEPNFETHRQILDDAVCELLSELAGFDPAAIDTAADLPDAQPERAKATAKADGQRVGGSKKKAQPRGKRRTGAVAD